MTETVPGGTTVFSCPLAKCSWKHAQPQAGGMLSVLVTEKTLADHMASHDLPEWVAEVVTLRGVMTEVAAELDERGRIGRTLLTGSYPTAANVARGECIRKIGRAFGKDPS